MELCEAVKKIRQKTGLNRKKFSDYYGIPLRTLEDWESGRRKPPEYVVRLLAYRIGLENARVDSDRVQEGRCGKISVMEEDAGKGLS